ncbi:MAG TPA: riboflavin synthase [Mycobacteriales bacterium]|jgi:riboflavin synthase|nr:riboflavin synthase [Mycobacteriales bacterium]
MFTGIVEELGEALTLENRGGAAILSVAAPVVATGARDGDSIAVNGVCLTVIDSDGSSFRADVMAETLRRSNIGSLEPGHPVNLERPVPAGGRLGGHIVQGHVDGVGRFAAREHGDGWDTVRIELPRELSRYVAEKGSIAVDGVSLTVIEVTDSDFSIGLIPTTLARTTLGIRQVGDPVNLEVDVLAKYTERLLVGADR